jgi:hypothetical protein
VPRSRIVDVHAQHLAEHGVVVLAVAELVVGAAAVAKADPKVAVGSEDEVTAVVVGRRLGDLQEHQLGRLESIVGVRGVALEARDHGVAVGVGVVDVKVTVVLVVGMEGQTEEALPVAGRYFAGWEAEEGGSLGELRP